VNYEFTLSDGQVKKTFKGTNLNDIVHQMVRQKQIWDWAGFQGENTFTNVLLKDDKDFVKKMVKEVNEELQKKIDNIAGSLKAIIGKKNFVDWGRLIDRSAFAVPKPKGSAYKSLPREPKREDREFSVKENLSQWLISGFSKRQLDAKFENAHREWTNEKTAIESENAEVKRKYEQQLADWEKQGSEFYERQKANNLQVETAMENYRSGVPDAIVFHSQNVLTNSEYSVAFPKEMRLEYQPHSKLLGVDYRLPAPDDLPQVKEVKYVQSQDEIVEVYVSEKEQVRLYDDLLYQVVLRSLYELLASDEIGAIESTVFNGWVRSVDKGTGNETNACILSVQVANKDFLALNLGRVDPKQCFRALKGIGSSKLHSLTPVPPILALSREDKRFIESHEVAEELNEGFNLAAMDWAEFEQLIREIFEKEFVQSGGEVKVTQVSRDGGVDAIAFDPDPIRGGKIVIQAKRYTNVVGVSAVRDLYGTVMNEGATKGILVTTSEYGPDAYNFAKGKPITLLTGGNLLSLLQKHGCKAKIDLREAKRILGESESGM
jgi:restriction system protein